MHTFATCWHRTMPQPRWLIAGALALTCLVSRPQPADADPVTPPDVPHNLHVEQGNRAFFEGHGVGTQNYICLPSGAGFKFVLFTPEATLFGDNDRQLTTHYFSPNLNPIPPEVANTIRATWQHSRDSSTVWAQAIQTSTEAPFVASDAIPWVLLKVVGAADGPTGGHTLTPATFVQRLNTAGGLAPKTGCSSSADVGTQAFVPYTADYFFYKKAANGDVDDDN